MPTIITHAVVGVALGIALRPARTGWAYWTLCTALPMLPDLDTPLLGAEGESCCSHRGLTHSLLFAATVAVLATALFLRPASATSRRRVLYLTALLFVAVASHGILDAFTDGGSGIMLLWPFDETRTFWSVRPISVAPLSVSAFFTSWGWDVLTSEMRWVWRPAAIVVVFAEIARRSLLLRSTQSE